MPARGRKGGKSGSRSRSKSRSSRRSERAHSEYLYKLRLIDVLETLRTVCYNSRKNEATVSEIEASMVHHMDRSEIWMILIRGQMQNLCSQVGAERWSTHMAGGDALPVDAKYSPLKRQKRFEDQPFVCFPCFRMTSTLRLAGHGLNSDGVLKLMDDTILGAENEDERRKFVETMKCWVTLKKMMSPEYCYCNRREIHTRSKSASESINRRSRRSESHGETTRLKSLGKIRFVDVLEALRIVCSKTHNNDALIADIAANMTYKMDPNEIQKILIRGQMQNLCCQVGTELWSTKMTTPVDDTTEPPPDARYASLKRQKRFENEPFTCFPCLKSTGSLRLVDHGLAEDGILKLLDDTMLGAGNADERRKAIEQLKCWVDLKKQLSPEYGYCRHQLRL